MKNPFPHRCLMPVILMFAVCAPTPAIAENLMIGFNRVTCLPKSDTFVAVPFMKHPVKITNTIGAVPVLASGHATLTPPEATILAVDELKGSHYLRFTSGALAGHWYDISGNAASSITIDLNGEDGTQLAQGDAFMVIEYWTLDTLFPPGNQTTIHVSSGNLGYQQKTKILFPNITDTGINLPAEGVYFLTSSGWKQSVKEFPSSGDKILPPGLPFIIRHSAGVDPTFFEPQGRVLRTTDTVLLAQAQSARQDNNVSVLRPLDVALKDAGLDNEAFQDSASHAAEVRKDELLVFDSGSAAFNKKPSAIYYKVAGTWFKDDKKGESNPLANDDKALAASTGLIVRKSQATANANAIWNNQPTY
jgi:uncharacterized protein (TIGR02597 family)